MTRPGVARPRGESKGRVCMSLLGSTLHEAVQRWWRVHGPPVRQVLLLDENLEDLTSRARVLRQAGYRPTMATDRGKALACLSEQCHGLVVLALDRLDGPELQLIEDIRRLRPSCPVVVVSSRRDWNDLDRVTARGASRLLLRSSTHDGLLAAARGAFEDPPTSLPGFVAAA